MSNSHQQPMIDTIKLFCVCDEEMCFCDVMVEVPLGQLDPVCSECDLGFHVWEMGGERDYGGAEYIGPPQ
jgi:hypothetical protein